jgi:hypothetical protein
MMVGTFLTLNKTRKFSQLSCKFYLQKKIDGLLRVAASTIKQLIKWNDTEKQSLKDLLNNLIFQK